MTIVTLALDDPAWTAFVGGRPEATPFHLPAWAELVARTYGFPAFALGLRDGDGGLGAGAPFVTARSLTGRRRTICLPFTDACAPLGDPPDVARLALQLAAGAHGRLEIRAEVEAVGWTRRADAVTHVLDLTPGLDAVAGRIGRSQAKRNIRRAQREGVTVRVAQTAADFDAFCALHARTRRRQGVPVQPRRFLDAIWAGMVQAGHGEVLLAQRDGPPVAAALFLSFNGTTIYKFGASDAEAWPLRPNHAIFWAAIERACARGDRRLDFGRTDLGHEGLAAFKRSWGAAELPLICSGLEGGAADGHESLASRALGAAIRRGPAWVGPRAGAALYRFAASR